MAPSSPFDPPQLVFSHAFCSTSTTVSGKVRPQPPALCFIALQDVQTGMFSRPSPNNCLRPEEGQPPHKLCRVALLWLSTREAVSAGLVASELSRWAWGSQRVGALDLKRQTKRLCSIGLIEKQTRGEWPVFASAYSSGCGPFWRSGSLSAARGQRIVPWGNTLATVKTIHWLARTALRPARLRHRSRAATVMRATTRVQRRS